MRQLTIDLPAAKIRHTARSQPSAAGRSALFAPVFLAALATGMLAGCAGETTEQAAMRETWEEACAQVEITGLYGLFSIPHISQVYMLFRGELVNGEYSPGDESLACDLFREQDIPWDEIAFPVVRETLLRYFRDKKQGNGFPLQRGEIIKHPPRVD
jgi:hypothetical protein